MAFRSVPLLVLPFLALVVAPMDGAAQGWPEVEQMASDLEQQVIEWRRQIHQNPELSNREFETAAMVAQHLESLGIEVTTGVAHTGVVGILEGGRPGPVIALRADMDALPVPERNDLPFRSEATGEYNGETVPSHACLRTRHPRRHPHGRGRGSRRDARRATGDRQVPVPARRGGCTGRGGGRRGAHDRGGRPHQSGRRRRLRAAHRFAAGRGHHPIPLRCASGRCPGLPHPAPWPADPRRGAVGGDRRHRDRLPDRCRTPDHRGEEPQHHGAPGDRDRGGPSTGVSGRTSSPRRSR